MKHCRVYLLVVCIMLSFISYSSAEKSVSKGYGFIDRNGTIIIEPQFQYASPFCSNRAKIFSGTMTTWGYPDKGHYGYIDTSGNKVIPLIYEEAENFAENGKAVVCKNGKYGIIDTDGNTVLDFTYDYISYSNTAHMYRAFNGTLSSSGAPKNGTYHILDDQCSEKCSITCDRLSLYYGYIQASKNEKCAIYSFDGERLTDFKYDFLGFYADSLLPFRESGSSKYGYMDLNGNVVIEPKFDYAHKYENGKAVVEIDNTWYLIDNAGNILTTYKYDYFGTSMEDGFTYAFNGSLNNYGSPSEGMYYLIDIDGNAVSRGYKKGGCYAVLNGLWRVNENNVWYVVNTSGDEIFSIADCESLYICGTDRFAAQKNGYWALLDSNGNRLTDYIWDYLDPTSDGLIPVYTSGNEPDFRSVRWGMSEEAVKAIEGSNPSHSGKLDGRNARYIGYNTTLMGNDVILAYYFGDNGLYEARYIWRERHSNESLYISDYDSVRTQLTKKYGDPWYDKENWDTTSHKNYYSDNKGNALAYGYLSYDTLYTTSRSDITMHMSADNYNISFIIYYESNTISAPEEDYSDQF